MNESRPNVILITTDQQRSDTIASRGNGCIDTPHLDWLCDEGVTYTNAYADFPLDRLQTLPQLLGDANYQTRAQGKMHFYPVRAHYGFQTMELPMDYYRERHRLSAGTTALPKEHGVGENEMQAVVSTVHENDSLTHWTVDRSIDFLETRDPTRPFFLWTSFTKPHPPFDPPANYWALYANRQMPDPVVGDWSRRVDDMPQAALSPTYILNNVHRFSSQQLANTRRAYYACITHIDYSLGLLFARMRELELLENSWIIFTSDHGENLGDHHMGGKSNFFEGSAHIPLIVRPPAASRSDKPLAGREVDTCVSLADVLPTICGITGVNATPAAPEGVDLRTLVDAPDPQRIVVGESGEFLALISRKWKYHYFVQGGVELLFDRESDPHEQRELIGTGAADPDIVGRLRQTLTRVLSERGSCNVHDGRLQKDPPLAGRQDVRRWPGFHSTRVETDVLH